MLLLQQAAQLLPTWWALCAVVLPWGVSKATQRARQTVLLQVM